MVISAAVCRAMPRTVRRRKAVDVVLLDLDRLHHGQ
jgi:hypothetical protein